MSRTYRDPIHKEITLDSEDLVENLLIQLIDCKEMQRLRWIRQLGTGWFTFHGAEASRFPHSLGAMHVARMMINKIQKDLKLDEIIFDNYRALTMAAALLHDIGHGPLSHSSEGISNIRHEYWSSKIILDPDTEVNQILERYRKGFSQELCEVLSKKYPVKFLSNIVSSQIDCDRFDYLLRDSYHTGTSYGNFDLNRVIASISLNTDKDCLVVSGQKGMLAVEDYLYARYSMYLQVYQHKKCLASDSLLLKLFQRVKMLIRNRRIAYLENPMMKWLTSPEQMSVQEYLWLDDNNLLQHIKHWIYEKDFILKDLAARFMHRKIFKAEKINKDQNIEELKKQKSQELINNNLDPEYYLDIISIASNPYSFYNPDASDFHKAIFVQNEMGALEEISTVSHVVNSLVKNDFENTWLIYGKPEISSNKAIAVL